MKQKAEWLALWIGLPTAVTGLLTLVLSILKLAIASPGALNLVVWIQEEVVVYPSEITEGLVLPFFYNEKNASSATLVKLNLSNFGSQYIGHQDKLWQISFGDQTASDLVLVGEIEAEPNNLVLLVKESAASNELSLQLGALEPDSHIDLNILVINSANPGRTNIRVSTSLEGLPTPLITRDSLDERLAKDLYLWVWPMFALALLIEKIIIFRKSEKKVKPKSFVWRIPLRAIQIIFMALIGGGIVSLFLGWLLQFYF